MLVQKLFLLAVILDAVHSSFQSSDNRSYEEVELEMVGRKGSQFVIGGKPFYVNGFNTYWLMIMAVDLSTRAKVVETFEYASTIGLTVGRTWAFNDGGWRALQKTPSVYDEDVFKALDYVLSEAKKHSIRLILSLANNWESFGGKAQYVKWGKDAGLNLTSDDDFFSDPTIKTFYKAHVNKVLNRVNSFTNITYKDDPTVFAWELMNEPRCFNDPSGNILQSWIEEMAIYVKTIDPKHLVEVGLEGFYGRSSPDHLRFNPNEIAGQTGTDFIRNHQALGIDFATAHLYTEWIIDGTSDAQLQFTELWLQNHIDDADNTLEMPVMFAEFGVSANEKNFSVNFRNQIISIVYKNIMNSVKKGGGGGGSLLWQLFPLGTEYMDDGYAVVPTEAASTSNLISLQSKRIQMFNSKCRWRCQWGCSKEKGCAMYGMHDDEL